MSRRGGAVYEERDTYYREGPPPPPAQVRVREREREPVYEEEVYVRREREGSRPEFLRDDYGRNDTGPLVLRERQSETVTRPRPRSPSPAPAVRIRERIIEREPSPPPVERVRTRVVERETRQRSPSPPPERLRRRVVETTERIRERSPSPIRYRERIVERERERERSISPEVVERVRITRNVERQRSPTPSPSPPRSITPPLIRAPPIHQEIITHHRHIDHGFERAPAPSPPPPPRASRTKETDIDIYTSRNNTEVDIHTSSRARTPQPERQQERAPARRENFYDDSFVYEQERDKLRVRDTRLTIDRRRSVSARPEVREKEKVRIDIREDDDESDYYAKKVEERAYIGEAYNGATKDWAIVDVPPGTERVRMDGVGGASQEITWQRYNGVRRSKFITERDRSEPSDHSDPAPLPEPRRERESSGLEIEISSRSRRREGGGATYEREYERIEEVDDRRVGFPRAPPKQRLGDLWTEITKDLVVREAIDALGYDCEETEFFFYILQYLRYDEVEELVALSKQIRRERRERIRELQREREKMERRERDREEWERAERRRERESGFSDERIIEREIIYDGPAPRRGPRRGAGW
ncbi:hypothetical protein NA56DRAFT_189413 [Hyaloscypha hepaticicola]|uniref:DUF8035 domain-containing protein n=1 Tax=Hyaloscypha hepaticicola TaxID=2082293 RepID=A0A2J6Q0Z0_9HELO|nr:hypothetical protein NA56DRAFT_189413 [Hyaloscypha hepaticicola]